MDKIIFYKKPHSSFVVTCALFVPFAIAWGVLPAISIYAYFSTHELSTKEFALCFPVGSVIWIALIVMTLYLMKYTSYRIIILCKNKIIFKSLFSKKQIEICEITSIKKENFVCGIVHGETLRTFRDYSEECINFETKKYKKTKYCLTCIPMNSIFNGSKEEVQKKVSTVLYILNKKNEYVEEALSEELIVKNEEYQKYGKLKNKVIKRSE